MESTSVDPRGTPAGGRGWRGRGRNGGLHHGRCTPIEPDRGSRPGVGLSGGRLGLVFASAREEEGEEGPDERTGTESGQDGHPPGVGRGVLHHGLCSVDGGRLGPIMDRPGPPGQDAGDDAEHPGERVDAAGPHLALERGDGRGVRPSRHLHALDPLPMGGELEVVVVQALVLDVVPARFGSDFLTELLELRVEVSPEGVHPGIEPLELAQDGLVLGWADGGAEGVGTGTEPGDLLGETH